ncbi:MAG: tyrosine-type recombinase/integrase [Solirubrobacteraceae bacterium]
MTKTTIPGIYKRGSRYVFPYRVDGKMKWESCRTLDEARRRKGAIATDIDRGEHDERSRITLHEYARDWIERYQGTGRRGFREETRDEYRSTLETYALTFFSPKVKLSTIRPTDISKFIAWTCQRTKPAPTKDDPDRRVALSDATVRNALAPLRSCLATARREGLIRHNPASEAALPRRDELDEDQELPRPFPRIRSKHGEIVETMELVIEHAPARHRLMLELLAATGVRVSELVAFEGRHLMLDVPNPYVKVRQRARRRRGQGMVIGRLKSRYSRREIPIPVALAKRLLALQTARDELVFSTSIGTVLDPKELLKRELKPACNAAGVAWAGFHTFRHTVASRLFEQGRNVVKVQRWLGHHSPSFTLDTYVHLLDDDLGEPLEPLAPAA